MEMDLETRLKAIIRDVPDFPKKGILFKDITPLLADPAAFEETIAALAEPHHRSGVRIVAAVESRGFIFGASLALRLKAGFVPIRKPGKLPYATVRESYTLEYGTDTLEMHADAVGRGAKVLIVDDLLATGGTAAAACSLVRKQGGVVVAAAFVVELAFLNGRGKLDGTPVTSLVRF
jgi:adenine phosphoribosyltransferase